MRLSLGSIKSLCSGVEMNIVGEKGTSGISKNLSSLGPVRQKSKIRNTHSDKANKKRIIN